MRPSYVPVTNRGKIVQSADQVRRRHPSPRRTHSKTASAGALTGCQVEDTLEASPDAGVLQSTPMTTLERASSGGASGAQLRIVPHPKQFGNWHCHWQAYMYHIVPRSREQTARQETRARAYRAAQGKALLVTPCGPNAKG